MKKYKKYIFIFLFCLLSVINIKFVNAFYITDSAKDFKYFTKYKYSYKYDTMGVNHWIYKKYYLINGTDQKEAHCIDPGKEEFDRCDYDKKGKCRCDYYDKKGKCITGIKNKKTSKTCVCKSNDVQWYEITDYFNSLSKEAQVAMKAGFSYILGQAVGNDEDLIKKDIALNVFKQGFSKIGIIKCSEREPFIAYYGKKYCNQNSTSRELLKTLLTNKQTKVSDFNLSYEECECCEKKLQWYTPKKDTNWGNNNGITTPDFIENSDINTLIDNAIKYAYDRVTLFDINNKAVKDNVKIKVDENDDFDIKEELEYDKNYSITITDTRINEENKHKINSIKITGCTITEKKINTNSVQFYMQCGKDKSTGSTNVNVSFTPTYEDTVKIVSSGEGYQRFAVADGSSLTESEPIIFTFTFKDPPGPTTPPDLPPPESFKCSDYEKIYQNCYKRIDTYCRDIQEKVNELANDDSNPVEKQKFKRLKIYNKCNPVCEDYETNCIINNKGCDEYNNTCCEEAIAEFTEVDSSKGYDVYNLKSSYENKECTNPINDCENYESNECKKCIYDRLYAPYVEKANSDNALTKMKNHPCCYFMQDNEKYLDINGSYDDMSVAKNIKMKLYYRAIFFNKVYIGISNDESKWKNYFSKKYQIMKNDNKCSPPPGPPTPPPPGPPTPPPPGPPTPPPPGPPTPPPPEPPSCKTYIKNADCNNPNDHIIIKEGYLVDENKCVKDTDDQNILKCIANDDAKDAAGNSYKVTKGTGMENIINNPYCSVYCKEDYDITMPDNKKTNNGRYITLDATITGTKSCYTSKININQLKDDLEKIIEKVDLNDTNTLKRQKDYIKNILDNYSACGGIEYTIEWNGNELSVELSVDTEAKPGWKMEYKFDPKIKFWYEDKYMNLLKAEDAYLKKSSSSKDFKETKYNCKTINDKYNDCRDSDTYEYITINYFDLNSKITPLKIKIPVYYVKQEITKSASYITPTLFVQTYPLGDVYARTIIKKQNESLLTNKLPISLSTSSGVYNYTLVAEKLGEYYNGDKTSGRIWGDDNSVVKRSFVEDELRESAALPRCINKGGLKQTFKKDDKEDKNGVYNCAYQVNCDDVDCPIVCEENCSWNDPKCSKNDCPIVCEDCIYNNSSKNFLFRPITPRNLNPNDRKLGINWRWSDTSTELVFKALAFKAGATTFEIQDAGEEIYNEKSKEIVMKVTMTPNMIRFIKQYNKDHDFLDNTLYCDNYEKVTNETSETGETIEKIETYKNIYCYSTFIDGLKDKFNDNIDAPNRGVIDKYWTNWDKYNINGTSWENNPIAMTMEYNNKKYGDINIGPSWK